MEKDDPVKEQIRAFAKATGFEACGFASAAPLEVWRPFYRDRFFMDHVGAYIPYLEKNLEKRINPELLLPGVSTIIALLLPYAPKEVIPSENNYIVSRYAYGSDYHTVIRKKLERVVCFLRHSFPGSTSRYFADSGGVKEKVWAQRCGVGWQGKNTLIIHREKGSWFFIGIILTTVPMDPDIAEEEHCGECRRCVAACPTGAIDHPYRLNVSRCIAYHTIESKSRVPANLAGNFHRRIFGCDICQEVCPYNRRAVPHRIPEFDPSPALWGMRQADWLSLTLDGFDTLFNGTAVKRAGYQRLMENILLHQSPEDPQR